MKSLLNVACRYGCVFKKFEESDKFVEVITELGLRKYAI